MAEEFGFTPKEVDEMDAYDIEMFLHYLQGKGIEANRQRVKRKLG